MSVQIIMKKKHKSLLIQSLGLFLFFMICTSSIFAEQVVLNDPKDSQVQKESTQNIQQQKQYDQSFGKTMTDLEVALTETNFSLSLELLQQMIEKVETKQSNVLRSFFPKTFEGFYIKTASPTLIGQGMGNQSYGVLFTQDYINKKGHSLNVNIVYNDDSIQDYVELINNPNLIQGLKNTKVIETNDYKSLETISDDQRHYEQSLIINNDLMVTLVCVGVTDHSIVNDFINKVDLSTLDTYLKK